MPISEARNVAQVSEFAAYATGVYVGKGLFLTNWHVCVDHNLIEVLGSAWPEQQWPRVFNDPGDGSPPYIEGTSFTDYVCSTTNPQGMSTVSSSHENAGGCALASFASLYLLNFTEIDDQIGRTDPKRVVYANIDLDLCIMELSAGATQRADSSLSQLTLDPSAPNSGKAVFVAGHPNGTSQLVFETCQVVSNATAPIKDPDTINPSTLVVPSFRIACSTIAPGSSGSPVFDPATGKVLGIVWTGESIPGATKYDHAYASSVSEWQRYVDGPAGREHHSRLANLLDMFTSP